LAERTQFDRSIIPKIGASRSGVPRWSGTRLGTKPGVARYTAQYVRSPFVAGSGRTHHRAGGSFNPMLAHQSCTASRLTSSTTGWHSGVRCRRLSPTAHERRSSGCAVRSELDERLCGDAEPVVQRPDHFEGQRAPAADSDDCGRGFRLKAATRSDRRRPPVPMKAAGVWLLAC
jgi:hypothetical protein